MKRAEKEYYKKERLKPGDYLNEAQLDQLRRHVQKQVELAMVRKSRRAILNELIVYLLLNTGLRAAEFCNLQMRDLPKDGENPQIVVRQGKGGRLRVIDVSKSTAEKIYSFVKYHRKHAKPQSFFILNERYKKMSYQSLYSRIKNIGKKAGLPGLHPHLFRHSYAMFLYAIDNDIRAVQRQLGHSSPNTTIIYANTKDEALRQQVERLIL